MRSLLYTISKFGGSEALWYADRRFNFVYTVSGKKVTVCIHRHNCGKQCQILTEF